MVSGEVEETEQSEAQRQLNQLMEMIVDMVATFDDRFSFTPVAEDGCCALTFTQAGGESSVLLTGTVQSTNQAIILGNLDSDPSVVVYAGVFDKQAVRERLSTYLAAWYGQLIRQPGQ